MAGHDDSLTVGMDDDHVITLHSDVDMAGTTDQFVIESRRV